MKRRGDRNEPGSPPLAEELPVPAPGLNALLALPFTVVPLMAAADASPSPDDLAAAAIRRLGLQTELPTTPIKLVPLPHVVGWVVLAVLAVVLVAILAYSLKGLRWSAPAGEASAPAAAPKPAGRDVVAWAEHLADCGRFVEAMHELLLEGVRDIRDRAAGGVAESLTSREILRHAPVPEPGQPYLRDLVARVEWSYFGEHPASLADYRACRESFDALRSALRRRASA